MKLTSKATKVLNSDTKRREAVEKKEADLEKLKGETFWAKSESGEVYQLQLREHGDQLDLETSDGVPVERFCQGVYVIVPTDEFILAMSKDAP